MLFLLKLSNYRKRLQKYEIFSTWQKKVASSSKNNRRQWGNRGFVVVCPWIYILFPERIARSFLILRRFCHTVTILIVSPSTKYTILFSLSVNERYVIFNSLSFTNTRPTFGKVLIISARLRISASTSSALRRPKFAPIYVVISRKSLRDCSLQLICIGGQ